MDLSFLSSCNLILPFFERDIYYYQFAMTLKYGKNKAITSDQQKPRLLLILPVLVIDQDHTDKEPGMRLGQNSVQFGRAQHPSSIKVITSASLQCIGLGSHLTKWAIGKKMCKANQMFFFIFRPCASLVDICSCLVLALAICILIWQHPLKILMPLAWKWNSVKKWKTFLNMFFCTSIYHYNIIS